MSEGARIRLCAVCNRHPVEAAYKPFCSRRCSDVDLQRWFSGAYAVPAQETDSTPDTTSFDTDR